MFCFYFDLINHLVPSPPTVRAQGARAGGRIRTPGRHVHGAGPGGRDGHGGRRRRGPLPAAVRHVPVLGRNDVRAAARRGRLHGRAGHRDHRPQTAQGYRAGHRPRIAHLLPDRSHQRDTQLGRERRVQRRKLQVSAV